jgi:hypothetical protein
VTHFSNFGPRPRSEDLWGGGGEVFVAQNREPTYFSRVDAKATATWQVTVDFSRLGTHLYLVHVSRFDPKVPHFRV